MEPFTEIPPKEGDDAFRVRLACGRHSETVCLACCMDFSLCNELRFDPDYLLACNDDERLSRVKSAVQSYFKKPESPEKTSSTVSPRLRPLLELTLGQENASSESFVELVSYLCYASRNNIEMVDRVDKILVTVLNSIKSPEAEVIAKADRGQAETKQQRKDETSQGQAPAEGSRSATLQETKGKLQDAYKEMITISIKTGVKLPEWGHFFADFRRVTEATEKFNAANLAKIMAEMDVSGDTVTLSDGMQEAMKAQVDWLQFLTNHTEGGIRMDDPSGWTTTKVHAFLKKQGLTPPMSIPNDVLVQIARHMVDFCSCCLVLLDNSTPDDEHAEALGRQGMGQATELDHQLIAQREAPVQRREAIMEAQIPASTQLSELSKWTAGNTLRVFETTRQLHKMNFNIRSLHEMLEQLDEIAAAFDSVTTGEYPDVLVMFSADEGTTEEKSLAVRALEAREIGGVPVLPIQWIYDTKKGAGPDAVNKEFRGIEKGKTIFHNHKISSTAMDLLLSLIAVNYDNLDPTDNVVKAFESQLPLEWKLSVLRPVDASKQGVVMNCPGCGKPAKKLCANCKNVAYCSRDCQVAGWKKHKPDCKAPP
jgi:hypothetical protein